MTGIGDSDGASVVCCACRAGASAMDTAVSKRSILLNVHFKFIDILSYCDGERRWNWPASPQWQVDGLFRDPCIAVEHGVRAERHAAVGYGVANLHAFVRRGSPLRPLGEIELFAALADIAGQDLRHRCDTAIPWQVRIARMTILA